MGGKGGGGGSSGRAGKAAWGNYNLAAGLLKQTKPLRRETIGLMMDALGGGDILQNRFLVPQLGQIESDYNSALRSILNNLPQGGGLDRALGDLEYRRAGSRSDAAYKTRMGLFDTAVNTAFGAPLSSSLSGMSNAANTLSGLQMQQNQLGQQNALGLGQGLGSLLGPIIANGGINSLANSLGSLFGGGGAIGNMAGILGAGQGVGAAAGSGGILSSIGSFLSSLY